MILWSTNRESTIPFVPQSSSLSSVVDKDPTSDIFRSLVLYTNFSHDASLPDDPSVSGMFDGVSSISDLPQTSLHVESPVFENESNVVHDFVVGGDTKNADVEGPSTVEIPVDLLLMLVTCLLILIFSLLVAQVYLLLGMMPLIILLILPLMKPCLFLLMLLRVVPMMMMCRLPLMENLMLPSPLILLQQMLDLLPVLTPASLRLPSNQVGLILTPLISPALRMILCCLIHDLVVADEKFLTTFC